MEAAVGFIVIYALLAGLLEIVLSILMKIPMLGTFCYPIIKFLEFIMFVIMIIVVVLYLIGNRLY